MPMKTWFALLSGMLLGMGALAPAQASDAAPKRSLHEDRLVNGNFGGFLGTHPDLYNYQAGAIAYNKEDYAKALAFFRKAAFYADKPSQAMIAEMLWNGRGIPQDRSAAYAWADLAAERNTPEMVALREAFWGELDEEGRRRALQAGEEIYARYGDDVAQPRVLAALRREKSKRTGSRLGSTTANVKVYAAAPRGEAMAEDEDSEPVNIDGEDFYAAAYWEPSQYFKWREVQWREGVNRTRKGEVTVGDPKRIRENPQAAPARPE